jgi:hypothetical protein
MAAEPKPGSSGLIPNLLGPDAFAAMPEAVQRVHRQWDSKEMTVRDAFYGTSVIARGSGWLSRICGFFSALPPANAHTPTRVRIVRSGSGEIWQREFDKSIMSSRLCARDGLLKEQLGAVCFYFALRADDSGFDWQVRRVRVLGLPLPARWFAGVSARSYGNAHGYAFAVRASLPIVGFIISYEGQLQ